MTWRGMSMPRFMRQFFIERKHSETEEDFERKLFVIRRRLHKAVEYTGNHYVVSLSASTIVYKGLLTGDQLPEFYGGPCVDPRDEERPRTRHTPASRRTLWGVGSWAHPYRYVAHKRRVQHAAGQRELDAGPRRAGLESDPLRGRPEENCRP